MAGAKKDDEQKSKMEIAMAISKLLLWIVANITVAAGAGAWRARGTISDVHEEVSRNSTNIQNHSDKLEAFRKELDREFQLREQTNEAGRQELNRRLDDMTHQMDQIQTDVRDLRHRADQLYDRGRNGAGQ